MEGADGVDDVDDDDVSGAACACGAPFSSFWLSICESDLDSSPLLSSCLSLLLLLLSSLSAGVITPFTAWLFAALVSPASTEDADSGVLMSSVRDGVCVLTPSHVYIAGPVSLVAGNPCINSYSDDVSEVSTTTMLLETFRNYSVEFDLNVARFLGWQWGVVGLCVLSCWWTLSR